MSSTEISRSRAPIPSSLRSLSAFKIFCAVSSGIIPCLASIVVCAVLSSISASKIRLSNSKEELKDAASSLIFPLSRPDLKFKKCHPV